MNLRKAKAGIFSLIIGTFLVGCDRQKIPTLAYEKFDDQILTFNYKPKVGTAIGLKGVYVMYGKTANNEAAGTLVGFSNKKLFRVKEVVAEYPNLKNAETDKVQDFQEKLFDAAKGTP